MDVLEWGSHEEEELEDFDFEVYDQQQGQPMEDDKEKMDAALFGNMLNDYAFSPSFHDFIGNMKEEFDTQFLMQHQFLQQQQQQQQLQQLQHLQQLNQQAMPRFQQQQELRPLATIKDERSPYSSNTKHNDRSSNHSHELKASANHQGSSTITGVSRPISLVQRPNQPPPSKIMHLEQQTTRNSLIPETNGISILIDGQPPVEVRTRTPSEVRTFSITGKVEGCYKKLNATMMKVQLMYAPNDHAKLEPVPKQKKEILGGTKTVPVLSDGTVVFDNLSISESSTRHKEREFCLDLILLRNDGVELVSKCTKPFYAYSHKKVLLRRGSVKLRTINKTWGNISGGEMMHVIGNPFIPGPALSLIFRTPHGEVSAKPLEYYSDSVLFFQLPPYPLTESMVITGDTELKASVMVTNDGRTFSNVIEFTYIADNNGLFRSRI